VAFIGERIMALKKKVVKEEVVEELKLNRKKAIGVKEPTTIK